MIIKKLYLKNFRNYTESTFEFSNPISVIVGNNGVGKTNLLEAFSMLEKPKGLRGGDLADIEKKDTNNGWFTRYGFLDKDIAIHYKDHKKKIFHLEKAIPHTKIHAFMKTIWLGTHNDRIFSTTPEKRRKFFDTVLAIFEPEYKVIQGKYLHYIFERTKLLYQNGDEKWLNIIEQKIYEHGITWTQLRAEGIEKLNTFLTHIQTLDRCHFAAKPIEFTLEHIKSSRERDLKMGGCGVGPHKVEYDGWYGEKKLSTASNGEQCLGQISIFLALIYYLIQNKQVLFLIDEIFSYLDLHNQQKLIKEFQMLPQTSCQFVITTPKVSHVLENVQMINLEDSV
ncbi:MAG: DNA replication/repair protein RecF [Alphaproteobacteria bacterium]|nr:MAG: DNA replication/repair protein RecF [Alphaproteobacteria bacterium]